MTLLWSAVAALFLVVVGVVVIGWHVTRLLLQVYSELVLRLELLERRRP